MRLVLDASSIPLCIIVYFQLIHDEDPIRESVLLDSSHNPTEPSPNTRLQFVLVPRQQLSHF